jgi:hypothetical protein
MDREIRDVRRCSRCREVIQALVHDIYFGDDGTPCESIYWLPRRKHTDDDCLRMQTLSREEWPTLW